ncbi:hypothetical protein GCM10022291_14810 [Postechiella marina]|uniref:Uncharacterized protein n=1 Tax=Postechiella marina TaxID=943941 RepID=A0ABP8C719_9FLAO
MTKTAYYKAFIAQTPEDILQSILKKDDDILIGISLNNGTYLEGVILDISIENTHQKTVCMLSQNEHVSFFNLHNITIVSIKQPQKMVVELSKGAISRPITANQELSILQLKRWLSNKKGLYGDQIKTLKVNHVSLNTLNNRLNIQDTFTALKTALDQVTKDDLGQEAWQEIETITLQQSDTISIKIEAKTLIISIAINKALPKTLANILEDRLLQIL